MAGVNAIIIRDVPLARHRALRVQASAHDLSLQALCLAMLRSRVAGETPQTFWQRLRQEHP
jgi:plasmid stability protein